MVEFVNAITTNLTSWTSCPCAARWMSSSAAM